MSIIDNVADIAAEVKRLRAEQAKPDQPSDAKPPTDPLEAMRQHLRELYGWDFGDGALDLMCGVALETKSSGDFVNVRIESSISITCVAVENVVVGEGVLICPAAGWRCFGISRLPEKLLPPYLNLMWNALWDRKVQQPISIDAATGRIVYADGIFDAKSDDEIVEGCTATWTKIKEAETNISFGWCDLYNLPY